MTFPVKPAKDRCIIKRRLEPPPYVVILNGAGSVGKTSTARALQRISSKPFLYIPMDAYCDGRVSEDAYPIHVWPSGRPDLRDKIGSRKAVQVLESGEPERCDRKIGVARWQHDRVHRGIAYDPEIDTTVTPPLQSAQLIRDTFGL